MKIYALRSLLDEHKGKPFIKLFMYADKALIERDKMRARYAESAQRYISVESWEVQE